MSLGVNIFIAVLLIGNIVGCLWLIWWTSRPQPGEEALGEEKSHVWDDDLRELNNPLPRWWLNLFLITIVFSVAYLVLYPGMGSFAGTLGWSQQNQHDERLAEAEAKRQQHFAQFAGKDIWQLADDPAAAQVAGRLFADNCAGCHGPSAEGAIGFPRLNDQAWLYGNSPDQIRHSLRKGRIGAMPAFGANLKPEETQGLIALMQDWDNPKAEAAVAEAARKRYTMTCAACHGADGTGNQMIGAPNLRDEAWLYGGDEENLRKTLTFGRNGRMPAHEDLLGETEIELLTAYVLRISGSKPQASQ